MDSSLFTKDAWGRLTKTLQGNAAFVPAPAPRRLDLSSAAIDLLDEASNRLGLLEGLGRRLPNPDLVIGPYLRREAVLSSRIEGTQTTLGDLYVTEAQLDLDVPEDVQEVRNYVSTYSFGLSRLDTLPLSLRLIRELHVRLMTGVRGGGKQPGEFRTYQNFIGGTDEENARYVPPPPLELKQCLDDLDRFMNDRSLRPVVQMAVLHYQFEAIHPFGDGNGRLGRLLLGLFHTERGLLSKPLLYLSPYFERSRTAYYDGLFRVSTHGDWDSWIRYVLEGIRVQAEEAIALAEELQELHARYRDRLQRQRATVNALALLGHVFVTPLVTTRSVQDELGVSHPTARAAIRALEEAEILRDFTPERRWGRAFSADEIFGLISGTGAGVPRRTAERDTAMSAR
jgi:cell filamentation protein, protein adenylyltransferase